MKKVLYVISVFAIWVGLVIVGSSMIIPAGIVKTISWLKT